MPDRADAPERPLLAPWITLDGAPDPAPVLMYADARGQVVRLRLDAVGLVRLALSAAEASAALARRDLNATVKAPPFEGVATVTVQPSSEAERG